MDQELKDTIIAEREALKYNASDKDLVNAIDKAIAESQKIKKEIDRIGEDNIKYWKAKQLDESKIPPKRAKIVDNRLFMVIETMIPILTTNIPEPQIEGDIDNEIREKLVKILKIAYEIKQKMSRKVRKFVRNWSCYRIGILKYRWQEGFVTEVINPKKIGFDPLVDSLEKADYVYEYMEDTLEDLVIKFPRAKEKILDFYGVGREKSKVRYVEFWGDKGKWVCWKLGDIILDKKKNPNFDYTGSQKKIIDENGEETFNQSTNNLFKQPKFPYIVGNYFQLGDSLYDNTSLIEQGKALQDAVNKRKNQISDITDLNKRVWIASSMSISRDDFQVFLNKTGENGVWLDRGDISQIQAISGQMDANAFNDLAHSINEIDNVLGTHSTTRGERAQQETLGGRQLLIGADYSRLGALMEDLVEQTVEDWYNGYLHMMKVFSQEDFEFSFGEETIQLNKEDIPEGITVMVKKGSTLLVDRSQRMEMAKELAKTDMIDPETLYQEMGYAKPQERAQKLIEWWRLEGKIQETPVSSPEIPLQTGLADEQAGGIPNNNTVQQLNKLEQIISSPKFKALPDEEKQQVIMQAKELYQIIKGGK